MVNAAIIFVFICHYDSISRDLMRQSPMMHLLYKAAFLPQSGFTLARIHLI